MELYIVGKHVESRMSGVVWEFDGVYDTQEAAEARCVDGDYFVGPAVLNVAFPRENIIWPDAYYPTIEGSRLAQ